MKAKQSRKKRSKGRKKKQNLQVEENVVDPYMSNSIQDSHIQVANARFFSQNMEAEASHLRDIGIALGVSYKGDEWDS